MFRLEIKMGNEAMQTPEDVALALQAVARRVVTEVGRVCGGSGTIRDLNGNTVGNWEYVPAN